MVEVVLARRDSRAQNTRIQLRSRRSLSIVWRLQSSTYLHYPIILFGYKHSTGTTTAVLATYAEWHNLYNTSSPRFQNHDKYKIANILTESREKHFRYRRDYPIRQACFIGNLQDRARMDGNPRIHIANNTVRTGGETRYHPELHFDKDSILRLSTFS